VDFRADNFIWAVKADCTCIRVSVIVFNCKHVGGNWLMALRSHAGERHGVAVTAHGNVGRKFVQVMHKERWWRGKWACGRVVGMPEGGSGEWEYLNTLIKISLGHSTLNNCLAEFGRGFPTVSCFSSATVLGIGGGQDVEIMRVLCALDRWLKSWEYYVSGLLCFPLCVWGGHCYI